MTCIIKLSKHNNANSNNKGIKDNNQNCNNINNQLV